MENNDLTKFEAVAVVDLSPSTWGLSIANTEMLILISLKNDQFIKLPCSILENKQKCLNIQRKKKMFYGHRKTI